MTNSASKSGDLSPQTADPSQGFHDALATAYWAWECLQEAKTLGQQAGAYDALSNAMHDLVTWHPNFNYETGTLETDDE